MFSTSTISLAIALVSVVTLMISSVDEFQIVEGVFDGILARISDSHLLLLGSNPGETPVAVERVFVSAMTQGGKFLNLIYEKNAGDLSVIVGAESYLGISLPFQSSFLSDLPPTGLSSDQEFYSNGYFAYFIDYVTFEGDFGTLILEHEISPGDDVIDVLKSKALTHAVTIQGL